MRTVLQRIEHALTFCHEYADGCWSIDTAKFRHHVTPELLEDTRQELESMQLKLMSAEAKLAEHEKRYPKSALETHPMIPNSKCKCEHWQRCEECTPSLKGTP